MKREIEDRLARADLCLDPAPSPTAPPTLRLYGEQYLRASASSLKPRTVQFYRDHFENHIVPLLGDLSISQLARPHLKQLIEALQHKGLKAKTMDGIVRVLCTIASEAVEDGMLPANPVLRPGRLRRRLRDPHALARELIDPDTPEEADLLLRSAWKRRVPARQVNQTHEALWYVFLLTALRTGMRLGELIALEWATIDWRQRFVMIERSYGAGIFSTPKNGKSRRVYLGKEVWRMLRWWRRQQRAHWFERGLGLPDLVFPSTDRTVLDDANIRKALLAIVKAAEVRRRRSLIHVLRHTYASHMLQKGALLIFVRDQLGHSSIQVTADVYGHLVPGGSQHEVDLLDDNDAGRNQTQPPRNLDGEESGEPRRNRTFNPQIKSLLLCQLS